MSNWMDDFTMGPPAGGNKGGGGRGGGGNPPPPNMMANLSALYAATPANSGGGTGTGGNVMMNNGGAMGVQGGNMNNAFGGNNMMGNSAFGGSGSNTMGNSAAFGVGNANMNAFGGGATSNVPGGSTTNSGDAFGLFGNNNNATNNVNNATNTFVDPFAGATTAAAASGNPFPNSTAASTPAANSDPFGSGASPFAAVLNKGTASGPAQGASAGATSGFALAPPSGAAEDRRRKRRSGEIPGRVLPPNPDEPPANPPSARTGSMSGAGSTAPTEDRYSALRNLGGDGGATNSNSAPTLGLGFGLSAATGSSTSTVASTDNLMGAGNPFGPLPTGSSAVAPVTVATTTTATTTNGGGSGFVDLLGGGVAKTGTSTATTGANPFPMLTTTPASAPPATVSSASSIDPLAVDNPFGPGPDSTSSVNSLFPPIPGGSGSGASGGGSGSRRSSVGSFFGGDDDGDDDGDNNGSSRVTATPLPAAASTHTPAAGDPFSLHAAAGTAPDAFTAAWDAAQEGGRVTGSGARDAFGKYGVSRQDLKTIWNLASGSKNHLDEASFTMALKLITLAQTGRTLTAEAGRSPAVGFPEERAPAGGGGSGSSRLAPRSARRGASSGGGSGGASTDEIPVEKWRTHVSDDVERSGSFFVKHTYYHVHTSLPTEAGTSSVTRKYSDFQWLHDTLRSLYPYRIIPPMPPKKKPSKMPEEEYQDFRRLALEEFVKSVLRRGIFYQFEDPLRLFFLTADTKAFDNGKKEWPPSSGETEFAVHPYAEHASQMVTPDVEAVLEASRDTVKNAELSLRATLDIVTDMLVNARDLADIMTAFGENLSQHNLEEAEGQDLLCANQCRKCTSNASDMATLGRNISKTCDELYRFHALEMYRQVYATLWAFCEESTELRDAYSEADRIAKTLRNAEKKLTGTEDKLEKMRRNNKDGVTGVEATRVEQRRTVAAAEGEFAFMQYCLTVENDFLHDQKTEALRALSTKVVALETSHARALLNTWSNM